MATTEEKKELVEHIKGPRFYRILLNGYGGEASYMSLTEKQYNFWSVDIEENGDSDAVNYCVNAEDEDFDFENIEELADDMKFLSDEDGPRPWYEAPTQFDHQWGIDVHHASIEVDEVSSKEYDASYIDNVVESQDLAEWMDEVDKERDYSTTINESNESDGYSQEPKYVLQFYSAEKGSFYDGIIETVGEFDPKKLKIYSSEFLNGDDTVYSIEYDGVEVDNNGGDTNGKGYSVHVWKN